MPKPCVGCGTLVESNGIGPMGMPLVQERRLREGEFVYSPTLCWNCRGAVLLQMRADRQLYHPAPGILGKLGLRMKGYPTPGAIPIFAHLHDD